MSGLMEKLDKLLSQQVLMMDRIEKLEDSVDGLEQMVKTQVTAPIQKMNKVLALEVTEAEWTPSKSDVVRALGKLAGMAGYQQPIAILQGLGVQKADDLNPEQYPVAYLRTTVALRRLVEACVGS